MSVERKYRALVVDDDPTVLQATSRALRRAGFDCEEAINGSLAWEKAQQSEFDVVVTDLRMPVANGHQLSVQLLELPKRPTIVVFTGVVEPRLANDLKVRGVEEILFKPMKYELLANRVRALVEQRPIAAPPIGDEPISRVVTKTTKAEAKAPPQRAATAKAEKETIVKTKLAAASCPSAKQVTRLPSRKPQERRPNFPKRISEVIDAIKHNPAIRTGLILCAGALVGSFVTWVALG